MNKPMPFDSRLVDAIRVNRSDVEQRTGELGKRRTFKVEAQVAAYLRTVRCLDLTTLKGDDTPGRVKRLCDKALQPVGREALKKLGVGDLNLTVGAVCVYHEMVREAVCRLR